MGARRLRLFDHQSRVRVSSVRIFLVKNNMAWEESRLPLVREVIHHYPEQVTEIHIRMWHFYRERVVRLAPLRVSLLRIALVAEQKGQFLLQLDEKLQGVPVPRIDARADVILVDGEVEVELVLDGIFTVPSWIIVSKTRLI